MATEYAGRKIVTNGLVLCLDAADRNSYVSGSTTWRDIAGTTIGTLTNGPTFTGSNGGAIVFDGTNDSVVSSSFPYVNGTSSKSLEVWFKPTGIDSAPVVQLGQQNTLGKDFEIVFTVEGDTGGSTNIPAQYKALGGIYGALWARDIFIPMSYTGSVRNKWHQVTLTLDNGSTGSLFYNGTLPQALKWSDPNWSQTLENQPFTFTNIDTGADQPLYIGRAASSSPWGSGQLYFPGEIALVRVYNRALTVAEVQQNFNAARSRFGI